ncbi:MAG TPA: DUF1801 domain-containing protein [Candidatus Dormibacteraeota bacterium]|nr:DUF1801 domain-containing protein [Candidatus Dormibacteraeota bacterium]
MPPPPRGSTLETYVAGIDPAAGRLVIALDKAIRTAHPGFDVAIKYRMLTYGLHGDWRTWVCAIGASTKVIALRFLYGVLLEDPRRVLRGGSSVLMSWDFGFGEPVDSEAVGAYVKEAVRKYDEYKANAPKVLEVSRAAAKAGRPSKARG